MPRILPLVAAQSAPRLIGEPIAGFADEVAGILRTCPETRMVIFPELHLFSDGDPDLQRTEALQDSAEPLAGPVPVSFRNWLATWTSGWCPAAYASAALTVSFSTP